MNAGKLIDAVHLVQAFGLSESFPPVPLLKTYLKDLRRNSQGNSGNALAAGVQVCDYYLSMHLDFPKISIALDIYQSGWPVIHLWCLLISLQKVEQIRLK